MKIKGKIKIVVMVVVALGALLFVMNLKSPPKNSPKSIPEITYPNIDKQITIRFGSSSVSTCFILTESEEQWLLTMTLFNGGVSQEETIIISSKDYEKLEAIFDKYKIWSWNNFDESKQMDGSHGFTLEIIEDEKQLLRAHGDGIYPENYMAYEKEVSKYLNSLFIEQGITTNSRNV
ncbi:hypothetical protein ACYSNR_09990 [Enterococcus sp. LJL128]